MADIELVIKIDEELAEALNNAKKENAFNYMRVYNDALYNALKNGTPLPKGHKRLIEDNFEVGPIFDEEGHRVGYQYVTQYELDNALTIVEADK